MDDIIIKDIVEENEMRILNTYGENLTAKEYITNPAIARESEIKKTYQTT